LARTWNGTVGAHTGAAMLVVLALAACGGTMPRPEPGTSQGTPPDLRGSRVVVLPVQQVVGVSGDLDAEIAFGLQDRSREVTWVLTPEVERMLARSPAIRARTRGLQVGRFLSGEVRRIGDPLYGELRRMSALVDADAILLPVQAAISGEVGEDPKINLSAAIVDPRTGRVAWFGVVEGDAFPAGDPRGLASVVDRLARTLLWYVGR